MFKMLNSKKEHQDFYVKLFLFYMLFLIKINVKGAIDILKIKVWLIKSLNRSVLIS